MLAPTLTAVFSGGILITTGIVGYYSYQAARSGPRKTPEWKVRRIFNGAAVELVACEGNPIVEDVTLTFPLVDEELPVRVDGPTGWLTFSPNQRTVFYPVWDQGVQPWDRRVRVQWKPTHEKDPGMWESVVTDEVG